VPKATSSNSAIQGHLAVEMKLDCCVFFLGKLKLP
jgi:hypothetical protein